MTGKPCKPNCKCGKHIRSKEHNRRIGESVKHTRALKKQAQLTTSGR